jgi:peptide deformylase
MAVRPTLQIGDPLLRTPCRKVGDTSGVDIRQLAQDPSDALADWVARTGYGRGIAAPQIGEPVRTRLGVLLGMAVHDGG